MTQKDALNVLKTGANVFLTGEPGAGKTYTINEYVRYLRERDVEVAITASTGIAATHIGGMTIHSWSGIGIRRKLDKYDLDKISSNEYVVKRISRAKVLVIDEISMLSAGTLSMVDAVCREVRHSDEAFGGLQVVFVGDFFQLPPIIKRNNNEDVENDRNSQMELLPSEPTDAVSFGRARKESVFAYDCPAWEKAKPIICYISEQYRQDDKDFLAILSAIRQNAFKKEHLDKIELRKVEKENLPKNVPKLFSHNIDVDFVNTETLSKIESANQNFAMTSQGPDALVAILQKGCLSPETLSLKVGAEVMFTKNNQKEGFVNGTLGVVVDFRDGNKYPLVKLKNNKMILVEPMEWSVEENGRIRAKIIQIPLRLAWAITVHKSQGMSMDSAIMDLSEVFEYGQGYVALSRVRRLSGLHIIGVNEKAFKVHPDVLLKDKTFRVQSLEAKNAFGNISSKKMEEMHNNFVLVSRGNLGGKRVRKIKNEKLRNKNGGGFDEIRKKFPNAYRSWSKEEDIKLFKLFSKNMSVHDMAKEFGRKNGAISARLEKLGLVER